MANDFKHEIAQKQEEIDMLQEKLMKKEGIENKLEEYKNRFQQYKDTLEIKNASLLQLKDQEQIISELKQQVDQSAKLTILLKDELHKEKESRI